VDKEILHSHFALLVQFLLKNSTMKIFLVYIIVATYELIGYIFAGKTT